MTERIAHAHDLALLRVTADVLSALRDLKGQCQYVSEDYHYMMMTEYQQQQKKYLVD